MTKFHVIIPARYASTRLPAKPLQLIGDKPMIIHVCEQAAASGAESIVVATDHHAIEQTVKSVGFDAVMTDPDHPSGSDRIFEAAEQMGLDDQEIIVNVQGDEPFIPPPMIAQVASLLANDEDNMATLCCEIKDADEVLNPNAVKVVFDQKMNALYFSRAPIPWCREHLVKSGEKLPAKYYRHLGIYGYRVAFLRKFVNLPVSRLEQVECLEQLRVLEQGYPIKLAVLDNAPPPGIDTEADLIVANQVYKQSQRD